MSDSKRFSAFILGVFIFLGLAVFGYLVSSAAINVKEYERTVTAKGLSEREYDADVLIWPIEFTQGSNDLTALYESLESGAEMIREFLEEKGIPSEEISTTSPMITDLSTQQYGNGYTPEFRYTALQTVTVYTKNIQSARKIMGSMSVLGKKGIVINSNNYSVEYIFTRLNEIKPEMVGEATRNARDVAQKFAADSQSTLGKIKRASQGQFSISQRDQNTPHIKQIRVVSTVEYYLSD